MPTQTLEFSAGTGLTISCKLFAVGSDTVVATATATEKTNDKNRYSVAYTDIPAGAYRMNAFVGAVGGFANEVYDLTLTTATFQPRAEAAINNAAIASAVRTELTPELNQLDTIQAKTDLIGTGSATVSAPVTASGEITEIVIGDDYLSSNSRTFDWTVDLPVGFTAGQTSCYFGGQMDRANKWLVQGAVTNVGGGKIKLSFELAKTVTEKLLPGAYDWSVEVRDSNGVEITRVRAKTTSAALVYKQT